jgi:hypothetical protein
LPPKFRKSTLPDWLKAAALISGKKRPSFYVFPSNKYYCFSCQSHGDSVDLLQQLFGFDFNQALSYLGIKNDQSRGEIRQAIAESRQRIRQKKRRIQFERNLIFTLGILIRSTHKAMDSWKSVDDLERYGDTLHLLPWWTFCHDTLSRGDQDEKDQVVRTLKDMPTLTRKYLWKGNFDYRKWQGEFVKNEEDNAATG